MPIIVVAILQVVKNQFCRFNTFLIFKHINIVQTKMSRETISLVRKIAIILLFYIDVTLHGGHELGWSSTSEIYRMAGYFYNCQDKANITVD